MENLNDLLTELVKVTRREIPGQVTHVVARIQEFVNSEIDKAYKYGAKFPDYFPEED